jgi:hypothetical protein
LPDVEEAGPVELLSVPSRPQDLTSFVRSR